MQKLSFCAIWDPNEGMLKRKETMGAAWKKERVPVSVVMYIEEGVE